MRCLAVIGGIPGHKTITWSGQVQSGVSVSGRFAMNSNGQLLDCIEEEIKATLFPMIKNHSLCIGVEQESTVR